MHKESNKVTKHILEVVLPEAKARLRSTAEEMEEEEELSKRWRRIRGTEYIGILYFLINEDSIKQ